MAKHLIAFGHGGGDTGTTSGGRTEAKAVRLLKPYLEKWGKRSKDSFSFYNGNLFKDRAMRKQKGYDTVTELHLDGPRGNGGHVIINANFKPDNLDKRLRDIIKKHFGIVGYLQKNNGFSYRTDIYNINQARTHGINYRLLEMFFLSNEKHYNHYVSNLDQIAKEIIEAIANTKISGSAKPVTPQTSKPKPAPSKPKPQKKKLKEDGYFGPDTASVLQRYFGLVVDGELWGQYRGNQATKAFNQKAVKYGRGGSPVVRALQKKIGATADGIWGRNTTSRLQRYLGTPVDGEIWRPSRVIKELQRRLNKGNL